MKPIYPVLDLSDHHNFYNVYPSEKSLFRASSREIKHGYARNRLLIDFSCNCYVTKEVKIVGKPGVAGIIPISLLSFERYYKIQFVNPQEQLLSFSEVKKKLLQHIQKHEEYYRHVLDHLEYFLEPIEGCTNMRVLHERLS